MNTNVKQVLETILEKFKSGDIPKAIAMATFPIPDTPSCYWSFTNRTLMFLSGTGDARGYQQWKTVNRWVKKGAKATYILVPCFKKEIKEETGEEKEVLRFFKSSAVFKVEDTDGEDLEYQNLQLPDLPLLDKANEWGISVKAVPGNYRYFGYYCTQRNEIALATPDEKTFFHEMAHAAHEKVNGKLKAGQDPFQEIIAELSSMALGLIVGKQLKDTTGNSFRYIERYAEKVKLTPHSACLKVLGETGKVLELILKGRTIKLEAA
ncbi:MAG: ArdC family protein [Desulfobacteraceae bacterium]|nr:antirestriction protein [Desulfobacteraceae bacterium]MBC2755165.1 ArdC family protein [Desulfobacteraceae bacterium]